MVDISILHTIIGYMIRIGFAAYSGDPTQRDIENARRLVETLYREVDFEKVAFLLGGYWGLMRVLVDELLSHRARVVLFPPLELEKLEYPEGAIVLRLGLSMRARSIPLVRSSDVFIVMGGEGGSILELVTSYDEGIPTYLLTETGHSTDKMSFLTPYLDRRRTVEIKAFNDPVQLAEDLIQNHLQAILRDGGAREHRG